VKDRKVGDRVVVSAPISCGQCSYCKEGRTSLCDTTNPSGQQEFLYGHRTAGILGYSHMCVEKGGNTLLRCAAVLGDYDRGLTKFV
jgi:threonine dehydrogenase-like Zn-dependent dehydrogenase